MPRYWICRPSGTRPNETTKRKVWSEYLRTASPTRTTSTKKTTRTTCAARKKKRRKNGCRRHCGTGRSKIRELPPGPQLLRPQGRF